MNRAITSVSKYCRAMFLPNPVISQQGLYSPAAVILRRVDWRSCAMLSFTEATLCYKPSLSVRLWTRTPCV